MSWWGMTIPGSAEPGSAGRLGLCPKEDHGLSPQQSPRRFSAPGEPQGGFENIRAYFRQAHTCGTFAAPSAGYGREYFRCVRHHAGLVFGADEQHTVTFGSKPERGKDLPGYAEIGIAEVRPFFHLGQRQSDPAKVFFGHDPCPEKQGTVYQRRYACRRHRGPQAGSELTFAQHHPGLLSTATERIQEAL